jgi:glutamate carboxypeptidase
MSNLLKHCDSYNLTFNPQIFLQDLVLQSSRTGDIAGINEIYKKIIQVLAGRQFEFDFLPAQHHSEEKMLVARRTGDASNAYYTTLLGHADCVIDNQTGQLHHDLLQGRMIAPGIADNKGGIAVGIEAIIEFLKSNPDSKQNIALVISPSEEKGSLGFHRHFLKLSQHSNAVFGLEPALNHGDLIKSRSGNIWYHITAIGKQGHSGRLGRQSQNAAHALVNLCSEMIELEKSFTDISVNIGALESDHDNFNQVCGKATAKIDVRFTNNFSQSTFHEIFEMKIKKIIKKHQAANRHIHLFYSIEDHCPSMNAQQHQSMEELCGHIGKSIFGQESFTPEFLHSGGAADINYFSACQTCLDGLGPIGGNLHRRDEYVVTASLYQRGHALARLLEHPTLANIPKLGTNSTHMEVLL